MWSYLARRLIQAFFTLIIITIICFTLTRLSADPLAQYAENPNMSPADRAALRTRLGLDDPLPVQYIKWINLVVHGDLGNSFFSKLPVSEMIGQRLPLTLELTMTAEVCTLTIALLLGIISAVKQYSILDNVITTFSFIGYSMPIFFIALGLIMIFAVQFKT